MNLGAHADEMLLKQFDGVLLQDNADDVASSNDWAGSAHRFAFVVCRRHARAPSGLLQRHAAERALNSTRLAAAAAITSFPKPKSCCIS